MRVGPALALAAACHDARHGRLIAEYYFGGTDSTTLFDVRSVTKSVVCALTGIALRDGVLRVASAQPNVVGDVASPSSRPATAPMPLASPKASSFEALKIGDVRILGEGTAPGRVTRHATANGVAKQEAEQQRDDALRDQHVLRGHESYPLLGITRAVGIPHRVGLYDGAALPHEIGERGPLDRESEPVLLRQGIGRDVDHQLQLAPIGRADDRGEIGLVGGEGCHALRPPPVQLVQRVGPAHQIRHSQHRARGPDGRSHGGAADRNDQPIPLPVILGFRRAAIVHPQLEARDAQVGWTQRVGVGENDQWGHSRAKTPAVRSA